MSERAGENQLESPTSLNQNDLCGADAGGRTGEMVEIGLMLSDRAGLRVVLAIKRIPMRAASRFHQIPCPCSSITGALKRSCNFVVVNSPTPMDDSWQKFMNPMNDDAVGPAAPPHFAHLLTHSLHPSHSILGVALNGWRNRHPNVHPSFPSTSPMPTQQATAERCPLHRDSAEILRFAAETCLLMSTTNRFISLSHGETVNGNRLSGARRRSYKRAPVY